VLRSASVPLEGKASSTASKKVGIGEDYLFFGGCEPSELTTLTRLCSNLHVHPPG